MIGTEEFNPEPVQENTALQGFEDVEETFSFSNLSLNNCDTHWDNFSKQDRSSSFDRKDFFGFFSEEFTSTASSTYSSDSIIFCGKLIPYRGETVVAETEQNLEITAQPKDTKKSSVFPLKLSHPFNKSTERAVPKTYTSPKKKKQEKSDKACESTNKGYATRKLSVDHKYDSSMGKVSPLIKTGCYSFRLGVGKFPMEMDLSDMKMRQNKGSPTPARMFPPDDESDQTDKSSQGKREKILWGLFRGKASLDCIPQV